MACLRQDLVRVSEAEFGGVRTSGIESSGGREQGHPWQCPELHSYDPTSRYPSLAGDKSVSGGEPSIMAMKSRWLFTPLPSVTPQPRTGRV